MLAVASPNPICTKRRMGKRKGASGERFLPHWGWKPWRLNQGREERGQAYWSHHLISGSAPPPIPIEGLPPHQWNSLCSTFAGFDPTPFLFNVFVLFCFVVFYVFCFVFFTSVTIFPTLILQFSDWYFIFHIVPEKVQNLGPQKA